MTVVFTTNDQTCLEISKTKKKIHEYVKHQPKLTPAGDTSMPNQKIGPDTNPTGSYQGQPDVSTSVKIPYFNS